MTTDYETAEPMTFFVRALYDYQSTDASSLTFRKGDLIEVLTQLPSGWWDGLLEDERGWFPSNYVAPVSEDEVEQEFRVNGYYQERMDDSIESLQRSPPTFTEDEPWRSNGDIRTPMPAPTSSSFAPQSGTTSSPDSWIPKMSPSGNIYYVNPETGEERPDVPGLVEDTAYADPMTMGTNAADMFGPFDNGVSRGKDVGMGMTGHRVRTPDPWIRKMTEDGMAYYYWNPVNHQVRWTPPTPVMDEKILRELPKQPYTNGMARRGTVSSAASDFVELYEDSPFYAGPLQDAQDVFAELGYSSGYDTLASRPPLPSSSSNHSAHSGGRRARAIRRLPDAPLADGQKALEYAVELQSIMNPEEEVQLLRELSDVARDTIQVVIDTATLVMDESPNTPRDGIDFIRERRLAEQVDDENKSHPQLSGRVAEAASAVLNLLLASGKLLPPMRETDLDGDSATQEYLKTVSSDPLTGFHRKVAANLSRLILSARAADSMPDARPPEMAAALERDARDLERSVVAFVLELGKVSEPSTTKRIRAVLAPGQGISGIGTGLIGGGVGGGWRANGFAEENNETQDFELGPPDNHAMQGLATMSMTAEHQLTVLEEIINLAYSRQLTSRAASPSEMYLEKGDPIIVEGIPEEITATIPFEVITQVVNQCQVAILALTDFLRSIESLDLAPHLDLDGGIGSTSVSHKSSSSPDDYESSVRQARHLMRTFEIIKQSLYDQGANLLMDSQTTSGFAFNSNPFHRLLMTSATLKSGTAELMETLESLIDVITSQAEAAQNGRRGRVGSRSSNHRSHSDYTLGEASSVSGLSGTTQKALASLIEQDGDSELTLADAIHPFSIASGRESFRIPGDTQQHKELISNDGPPAARGLAEPPHVPSDLNTVTPEMNRSDALFDPIDVDEKNHPNVMSRRERKLKNLLGPDAPIAAQTTPTEPEYMRRMYGPPDILLNSDLGVRGGTLPALVEHLTLHNRLDSTFNETFLMTFKSFATVDEVVSSLIARFNLPPPENLTPDQFNEWKEVKQKRYRFRTMNILKALIQSQTLDQKDLHVLDRIRDFADSIQENDMNAPKMQVLQTIKMRTDEAQAKKYTANGLQDPPPSILPKNLKKFKLNELDPVELARQLTIIESRLFNRVHPTECLERGKDKPATSLGEDNIKAIIHMSNQMAAWVTDTVLAKDEVKKRAGVLRYWISVAEQCKRLKNYSTMAALIAGLNCPPIRRLRRSWEQVHQRANTVLADLEKTIDSGRNFAEYRRLLASINPPCVPFFGLFLKDLTFIQDGNNNFIPVADGKVINFDKRQKQSQVIREIQRYQAATYDLTPVEAIIEFIDHSLGNVHTETDYWPLSLEREPREREEERMARLLQESGFL